MRVFREERAELRESARDGEALPATREPFSPIHRPEGGGRKEPWLEAED